MQFVELHGWYLPIKKEIENTIENSIASTGFVRGPHGNV